MGPWEVRRCLAPLIVLLLFCRHAAACEIWCIASPGANDKVLQEGLNWACGTGGADCSAIQPGGSCAVPDTVRYHASYAFNSYYQMDPVQHNCDFGGSAIATTTDPSTATCKYPSRCNLNATRNAGDHTVETGLKA